jgi:hypothetical protein
MNGIKSQYETLCEHFTPGDQQWETSAYSWLNITVGIGSSPNMRHCADTYLPALLYSLDAHDMDVDVADAHMDEIDLETPDERRTVPEDDDPEDYADLDIFDMYPQLRQEDADDRQDDADDLDDVENTETVVGTLDSPNATSSSTTGRTKNFRPATIETFEGAAKILRYEAPARKNSNIFHPFRNRLDFEVAHWAKTEKISQSALDRFLGIEDVGCPRVYLLYDIEHCTISAGIKETRTVL